MAKKKVKFEDHLEALESIVQKIDQGDISLDEHIELYEAGVKAIQQAQDALSLLEKKVEKLDESLSTPNPAEVENNE